MYHLFARCDEFCFALAVNFRSFPRQMYGKSMKVQRKRTKKRVWDIWDIKRNEKREKKVTPPAPPIQRKEKEKKENENPQF